MAEKKKTVAEPSDADPCSVLALALKAENRNYNDQQTVAMVDAAEAILERAAALGPDYAEKMPPEYVVAAIEALRAPCTGAKPMQWHLKVRVAKILLKYEIPLKDPK